ncbi:hypothetical protein EBX31_06910 [bacterium]|nr:hypothetical protein [bacterium]
MAQKLEAHSITSLAHRLKLLVSRATLRDWIKSGKLKPEAIQAKASRYLIFSTEKLNKVLSLLEQGFEERIGRLAKNDAEAVRFRAQADALALEKIQRNKKRAKEGKEPLEESSPALNDDDARGLRHLRMEDKPQRLFTGYGLYR